MAAEGAWPALRVASERVFHCARRRFGRGKSKRDHGTRGQRDNGPFAIRDGPDCGRSPSAARGQAEALRISPTSSGQATRCEPGRFAVRPRGGPRTVPVRSSSAGRKVRGQVPSGSSVLTSLRTRSVRGPGRGPRTVPVRSAWAGRSAPDKPHVFGPGNALRTGTGRGPTQRRTADGPRPPHVGRAEAVGCPV